MLTVLAAFGQNFYFLKRQTRQSLQGIVPAGFELTQLIKNTAFAMIPNSFDRAQPILHHHFVGMGECGGDKGRQQYRRMKQQTGA